MFARASACLLLLLLGCDGDQAKPASEPAKPAEGKTEKDASEKDEPKAPKGPALPSVDAAKAKQAVEALSAATPEQQPLLATKALAELEAKRLPASLVEGLDALSDVPPDQRAVMLAKSISTNIGLLDQACGTDARKLMQSMATMAPESRDDAVWTQCKLLPHGLMQERDRAGSDPLHAMVAHMVFVHLEAGGGASDDEKALLKMMMRRTETDTP